MNLAMIFAMLLQSGICAQSQFHDSSGRTLMVMVCPRMSEPGVTLPDGPPSGAEPTEPDAPDASDAPAKPGSNT